MRRIAYRSGYKYQLEEAYAVAIDIRPVLPINTRYIKLDITGTLTIQEGYAWDGPSGPTFDTPTFMRGSLVHDALYQLMRERHLDRIEHRQTADRILRIMCRSDGMWPVRAWWVYWAVRIFADPAADPASRRPVTRAPEVSRT